ncbi:transglutaminase N-terminal domain-containing protein [Albidovulum sediminis]|uniref:transglutaminase N-terminal domain-containing protein n=1 Tax=Albidovulum sediminis TaxID=3066345 RepID=UPI0034E25A8F
MPSVTITRATSYRYRTAVSFGPQRLMLRPRETRDLRLTSFELEITPEARIDWFHDVAGNAVTTAQLDTNTTMLSVRSRVHVETARQWRRRHSHHPARAGAPDRPAQGRTWISYCKKTEIQIRSRTAGRPSEVEKVGPQAHPLRHSPPRKRSPDPIDAGFFRCFRGLCGRG